MVVASGEHAHYGCGDQDDSHSGYTGVEYVSSLCCSKVYNLKLRRCFWYFLYDTLTTGIRDWEVRPNTRHRIPYSHSTDVLEFQLFYNTSLGWNFYTHINVSLE